jgi:predicted Fe-Mo cluster-binding NifX family protein
MQGRFKMVLCIPINENNGLESLVYSHFGSASTFILYDNETSEYDIIDNSNQNHVHGACHPMDSINGKNVDAILVGGIGARAIDKLNAKNIKVYQATTDTVQRNIDMFNNSLLKQFTLQDACAHHNHGRGCN